MPVFFPPGEHIRRAAAWVAAERSVQPDAPLSRLLDEAGMRFSLSPLESQRLAEFFTAPEHMGNLS